MKFNKEVNIKIIPDYVIKEPISTEEEVEINIMVEDKGGYHLNEGEGDITLTSGGAMNWQMYQTKYPNQITGVQLMRLWVTQMMTQMVNNKAFINEAVDEPRFDITDEEKEVFAGIIKKLTKELNDCLEKSDKTMITNKKKEFKFGENE